MSREAKALYKLRLLKRNILAARVSAARRLKEDALDQATVAAENLADMNDLVVRRIAAAADRQSILRLEASKQKWAARDQEKQRMLHEARETEAQEVQAAVLLERRIEGLQHLLEEFATQDLHDDGED